MDNRFHGLRATSQRVLIYDFLALQTAPKSVEEIYNGLPEGVLDLSTVYRTLDAFAKAGIVTKSFLQNKVFYHLIGHEHKHFLVCLDCHQTEEIDACPFHDFESKIESDTEFHILFHPVELFGYCKKCKGNHPGELHQV
jgi:Fur family transcriptional regulator, ferric uptake regulator